MPSMANFTTSGSSVSSPKVAVIACSGRTQFSEPDFAERAPQRIDFGQGKVRTITGSISASTSMVARPFFSISAM